MESNKLNFISKFLMYALLATAMLYIVTYLYISFFRIQYPFELEWMEGGSVDHVKRILSGQKLYVSPSLEFVPFIYTPLYFYLSAVISNIVSEGFLPLRLVSFLSSLGCFFFIFLIVKRETGSNFSGFLASCLFAATFRISGAWFDISRVDSLFLFLLLASLYLLRNKTSLKSYAFAGVFISLSFLTKQIALIISLPIMAYCIIFNRRYSMFFVGTIAAIIGGSTLLFNYIHDGWYNYYIFKLPAQHSINISLFFDFWIKDLLSPLSVACIVALFYIFTIFTNISDSNRKNCIFFFFVAVGMVGGAWFSRMHVGGYDNVLFPAYAIISILFGLATYKVFEFIQGTSIKKRKLMEISVYLIYIIQFTFLGYNPLHQIPTQKDLEAGRELVHTIKHIKGEVFVPYHGYLASMAGKNSYAHAMAIMDVSRGDMGQASVKLTNEIKIALEEQRFSAIVFDPSYWFQIDLKNYIMQRPVFKSETVFRPVTGIRIRPQFIYIPRDIITE